ncbi:Fcf1-domain-containing protein [Tuber borchii]|uniref:U three protein 23 n=1 Tax=Tuber borchii TaxID=42251 RepID=A0A2T7A2U4_TUBBO|nr:Fcf1-domain-containing protein [Tuber borchii]
MRGKRSKAYRKLMSQYNISFGFREPYQVLLDAEIVKDSDRFKMDLVGGLERTLQGQVKPMITQCSIRHLYALTESEFPERDQIIALAKRFERRRCNHHELEQPLSEKECLEAVIIHDGENKHRYCVATQGGDIRAMLRAVPGVPLIYINRSVMIMEPMAPISAMKRERGERQKFRAGIIDTRPKAGAKRKRLPEKEDEGDGEKKKKRKGPKGPNPLSVKKKATPKPVTLKSTAAPKPEVSTLKSEASKPTRSGESTTNGADNEEKKKRKRRHKNAKIDRAPERLRVD